MDIFAIKEFDNAAHRLFQSSFCLGITLCTLNRVVGLHLPPSPDHPRPLPIASRDSQQQKRELRLCHSSGHGQPRRLPVEPVSHSRPACQPQSFSGLLVRWIQEGGPAAKLCHLVIRQVQAMTALRCCGTLLPHQEKAQCPNRGSCSGALPTTFTRDPLADAPVLTLPPPLLASALLFRGSLFLSSLSTSWDQVAKLHLRAMMRDAKASSSWAVGAG